MMMMHVQLALVLVSGNSLTKVSHCMFMLEVDCYHHNILQVSAIVQYKLPPNNDKSCYDKNISIEKHPGAPPTSNQRIHEPSKEASSSVGGEERFFDVSVSEPASPETGPLNSDK